MGKFLKNNGLSLVLLALFLLFWAGQALAGYLATNHQKLQKNLPLQSLGEYLTGGEFLEATAENWESEFLQLSAFVLLGVWLYQKGSAESKDPDSEEDVDVEPPPGDPNAPWPVRKGGWILAVYKHSLTIAFFTLFVASFVLHSIGGLEDYNERMMDDGLPTVTFWQFVTSAEFWFQSLQNWQSEFLAIFFVVVLTIYLRQKGSPQSKPVHAPHGQTGV